MLFNRFLILFLTNFFFIIESKNYTGHHVYKIHAKNLIQSYTEDYLDEDGAILLSNGSIPLPEGLNKLWQGYEQNGDEYAIVHIEPNKNKRFKRDLNYQLLTDDLNQWINGNFRSIRSNSISQPIMQPNAENLKKYLMHSSSKELDTSESNIFQSHLNPNYDSFWSLLQSPFKTLVQLTNWNNPSLLNWNLIPISNSPNSATSPNFYSTSSFANLNPTINQHTIEKQLENKNPINDETNYRPSASINTIRHTSATAAQEEAPVYLSAFIPNFRLDNYHNLEEIYDYLDKLVRMHKHMRLYIIGYSHENRPIKAIEIHQDIPNLNKKMVYLDGLIHAREHITSAALLNIIEQILIREIECNFLIVPIINVDGYVYTWTTDRLWRKNRRKTLQSSNNSFLNSLRTRFASEKCNGVDLNRNFDINFGGVGSSLNPCSELYAGPHALSEPETSALARILWDNRHRIKMTLTLHSFGQLWAAPLSYTRAKSPHHDLHMNVLKEVQQAVYSVNNVLYNVGPLGSSLYLGSGYSLDYSYQKLNIIHSYLVEVRDKGDFGFLLPQDQILPTSFEILEGILVSIKRAY